MPTFYQQDQIKAWYGRSLDTLTRIDTITFAQEINYLPIKLPVATGVDFPVEPFDFLNLKM